MKDRQEVLSKVKAKYAADEFGKFVSRGVLFSFHQERSFFASLFFDGEATISITFQFPTSQVPRFHLPPMISPKRECSNGLASSTLIFWLGTSAPLGDLQSSKGV
jgi:hypothetical protein